jgi:hypothetical protein
MMEIAGEEHQQWQRGEHQQWRGVRLPGPALWVFFTPPLLVFFTNRLNSPQSFAKSKTKQTENLTI